MCMSVCACACVMSRPGKEPREKERGLCLCGSQSKPRTRAKLRLKLTQALSCGSAKSPLPLLSSPLSPPAGRAQSLGSAMNKWRRGVQQSGPSLAVSDTVDDVQSQPHTPRLALTPLLLERDGLGIDGNHRGHKKKQIMLFLLPNEF